MGYRSSYRIEVINAVLLSRETRDIIRKILTEFHLKSDTINDNKIVFSMHELEWYNHDEDLAQLSRIIATSIYLYRVGENVIENSDITFSAYKNGEKIFHRQFDWQMLKS